MWFEIITNTQCNWNCVYCAFKRVPNVYMTQETINKHEYVYDYINKKKNSTIVIEGGEIGLIKDNYLLEELFTKFNNKIIINTNGTFFDIDRSSLYKYIDKVFYHVAPDAKTLFKIELLDVPMEVIYGLVDDDEVDREKFVLYNNHIKIDYLEYEYISKKPAGDFSKYQSACALLNPFVSVDLAREVLCMCTARGCHVTIPLTEENFNKVLTEFNNFGYNDMCETCYRTCKNVDILDTMTRKKCEENNIR